jgi:hypothetical protein
MSEIKPTHHKVYCKDGFSISIQASKYHYCTPREDIGPYSAFELGYPSIKEELIMEYAEDSNSPTDTIYGYVPLKVVENMIEKHGGIDISKSW